MDGEGWFKQDKPGPLETHTKEKTKRKIDRKLGEAGGRDEIWGRILVKDLLRREHLGRSPQVPRQIDQQSKGKGRVYPAHWRQGGQSGGVGCGSLLIEGSEKGGQWRVLNQRAS